MGNGPGGGGPGEMMGGRGGGGGGMDGFHHAAGALDWAAWMTIPILIFVLVGVALAAYAVWKLRSMDAAGNGASGEPAGAEAVLAHRLATGEIGADDYTRRIAVLRSDQPTQG